MSQIDHTRILNAYLSRLTENNLFEIIAAKNNWKHASLNLGNTAQLIAQAEFYNTVSKSIESMMQHDLSIIDNVITDEVTA